MFHCWIQRNFVFLAGWAMRKLIDGPAHALPAKWLVWRLESRAWQIYIAQLIVTEFAIAMRYLCLFGRNSLIVFCTLSLLSLWGQIFRYIYGGSIAADVIIVFLGFLFMGLAGMGSGMARQNACGIGKQIACAAMTLPEFEGTIRSTVRWLKENQIDVVLVGVQYTTRPVRDENYLAIRDSLQKIAAEEKILYVRRYDAMRFIAKRRANLQLMAGDNFHLNDLGYHCMAEHVAHAVIVSLFSKKRSPQRSNGLRSPGGYGDGV